MFSLTTMEIWLLVQHYRLGMWGRLMIWLMMWCLANSVPITLAPSGTHSTLLRPISSIAVKVDTPLIGSMVPCLLTSQVGLGPGGEFGSQTLQVKVTSFFL